MFFQNAGQGLSYTFDVHHYHTFIFIFRYSLLPVEDCRSSSRKLVILNIFSQRSFLNFNMFNPGYGPSIFLRKNDFLAKYALPHVLKNWSVTICHDIY